MLSSLSPSIRPFLPWSSVFSLLVVLATPDVSFQDPSPVSCILLLSCISPTSSRPLILAPLAMPNEIRVKAKKDKIVNYHADGSRETVGYRIEEWTERTKTTGPRAKGDVKSAATPYACPSWTYTSSKDATTRSKSTNKIRTTHTVDAYGHPVKPKGEFKPLPPVVETKKRTSKQSFGLTPMAANLPSGWVHKEKYERYDYHQGVRRPSYAVNSLTHKVDYAPPTPVGLCRSAIF